MSCERADGSASSKGCVHVPWARPFFCQNFSARCSVQGASRYGSMSCRLVPFFVSAF